MAIYPHISQKLDRMASRYYGPIGSWTYDNPEIDLWEDDEFSEEEEEVTTIVTEGIVATEASSAPEAPITTGIGADWKGWYQGLGFLGVGFVIVWAIADVAMGVVVRC
jgi:hypothetical protein